MLKIKNKVGPKTDKYGEMKKQEPPFCECGCGRKTKWCNTRKRFCRFVNGHNSKTLLSYYKGKQ